MIITYNFSKILKKKIDSLEDAQILLECKLIKIKDKFLNLSIIIILLTFIEFVYKQLDITS